MERLMGFAYYPSPTGTEIYEIIPKYYTNLNIAKVKENINIVMFIVGQLSQFANQGQFKFTKVCFFIKKLYRKSIERENH